MIKITFKGVEYEIPYDNDSLKINRAIDSTFDNGYFVSTPVEASSGLDFSRRIPRNLLVKVTYQETDFIFKTGETYIDKFAYGVEKYVHRVNLISLAKDLTKKPLENMTLQQPKGDFGLYSRSVNRDETFSIGLVNPVEVVSYTNLVNSNTTKINALTIVSLEEYTLTLETNYSYAPTILNRTFTIRIKYGATTLFTENILVPSKISFNRQKRSKTFNYKYTPTATGTFTVEYEFLTSLEDTIEIDVSSFSITALQVLSSPVRTYAQLIDKMLSRSEYVLSASSRSRLSLTAPEGKFEDYTLYDALNKIGGELGALVRVGDLINERYWKGIAITPEDRIVTSILDISPYEVDDGYVIKAGTRYYEANELTSQRREILFEFFDNPQLFNPIGEFNRSEQAELEDYVSALELNTRNILKPLRYSPFRDGWKGLRNIDGIGQMTAENVGYETEDKMERMIKVLVKGLASENATGTVTYTVDDITDITDRVLEKRQWDTLTGESDYSYVGKGTPSKNNHLYYVQGDNKIYGMSNVGEHLAVIVGNPDVTRAVYETILATRSVESGERIYRDFGAADDINISNDRAILFQITYSNQTESRARIYKDDQSGFDTELIKYFNESANVNESESIGNYAQQIVNRLGGTKIVIEGVVDTLEEIAQLGDVDSLGRVYTLIDLTLGRKIHYQYTLVQDYNVISSYIGIQSRHRIEEISSDSTTDRVLRYTSKVIFTDSLKTFTTRLVDVSSIFEALGTVTTNGITYGYIECNLSNGVQKKIHLSVDSDSKGKTIELKWAMMNNFSAGLKRYSVVRGGDTLWLNTDVDYVDYFGKVNDILFSLYESSSNTYDQDLYPEATAHNGLDVFTTITDTIDKDGQEVLHGLVEIPILSESTKIRVYNGFARWNKLVEGTDRIRACLLQYVPQKNANKIDLTRISDLAITPTVAIGYVNLSFNSSIAGVGVAFYNIDTLDLVLAYIDTITTGAKNIPLYYYIEDSKYGGGQNFTTRVILSMELDYILSSQQYEGVDYSDSLTTSFDWVKGQDEAEEVTLETSLGMTFTAQSYQGYDFAYGMTTSFDWDKGQDNVAPSSTNNYDLDYILSSQQYNGVQYNQVVNVESVAQQGLDLQDEFTVESEINETLSAATYQGVSYTRDVDFNVAPSALARQVEWVAGGSSATLDTTCDELTDEGNRKFVSAVTTCSFAAKSTYISATDDTLIVACSQGAERVLCEYDEIEASYLCTVTEGTEVTNNTYATCTLKEVTI